MRNVHALYMLELKVKPTSDIRWPYITSYRCSLTIHALAIPPSKT